MMLNLYNRSGTILISGRGMDLRTFQGHSQDQESLRAAKTVFRLQQRSTLSGWPSCIASDPPISPAPDWGRDLQQSQGCTRWERAHTSQETLTCRPQEAADAEISHLGASLASSLSLWVPQTM